jgi:uncharacterized membrane protein YccF (DUF307 family)
MTTLGNILWVIFGGVVIFLLYLLGSIFLMITIIGIPFGIQTLKIAGFAIWPFGRSVRAGPKADNALYIIMNVIWILVAGLEIAILHFILMALFAITIIGIPLAKQHFKLAIIALVPFGQVVENPK